MIDDLIPSSPTTARTALWPLTPPRRHGMAICWLWRALAGRCLRGGSHPRKRTLISWRSRGWTNDHKSVPVTTQTR